VTVSLLLAVSLSLGLACPRRARANGAFPDSLQVLLPPGHPSQVIFTTNFGLVISEDDGRTWSWSCEQPNIDLANLYQVGPAPDDTLYAISPVGFGYSNDGACTWELAKGALETAVVTDAFADPTDPSRVWAVAIPRELPEIAYSVYESRDGGRTFGPAVYTAPVAGGMLGVEIARSDPRVAYIAMYVSPGIHPRLVRTTDGGATWDPPLDIEVHIGANWYRVVAIDPQNPAKIFFRVASSESEVLAITEDGGATFHSPVAFVDRMTAFVQTSRGTILVTGTSGGVAKGFRSHDGGRTFTPWEPVPNVRALGERDGKLYVVADNFMDGYAIAVSDDDGDTLVPLTTYDKVSSIKPCARGACLTTCRDLAERVMLWPGATCGAGGGRDGEAAEVSSPAEVGGGGGCSCGHAASRPAGQTAAAVVSAALFVTLSRRRRRR
jgi:hypothetical protein